MASIATASAWRRFDSMASTNAPGGHPKAGAAASTPAPESPTTVTNPVLGKATIEGRILSSRNGKPLPATAVWLARIYGEGSDAQFVLNGSESPNTTTTSAGTFTVANVDAADYVIVVGDPYSKSVIVSDSSGKARVWHLTSEQILNTQDIRVDLGR